MGKLQAIVTFLAAVLVSVECESQAFFIPCVKADSSPPPVYVTNFSGKVCGFSSTVPSFNCTHGYGSGPVLIKDFPIPAQGVRYDDFLLCTQGWRNAGDCSEISMLYLQVGLNPSVC